MRCIGADLIGNFAALQFFYVHIIQNQMRSFTYFEVIRICDVYWIYGNDMQEFHSFSVIDQGHMEVRYAGRAFGVP
jgi:hypothetical protein